MLFIIQLHPVFRFFSLEGPNILLSAVPNTQLLLPTSGTRTM
jgi:hypothetical protein